MDLYCCVCGEKIDKTKLHYSVAPNTYVCFKDECYNLYFWDRTAARVVTDYKHEYVVVSGRVYQIGDERESKGFGGHKWVIKFSDGVVRETTSLWFIGLIPSDFKNKIKDNAIFLQR